MQIKTKLLLLGISTVFVLTTYHLLDNYLDYKNNLTQTKSQHASQYQHLFEQLLKEQYSFFSLGLLAILDNQELVQLFAERKREELFEKLRKYYNTIKQDFFLEHMHFHLPPAKSFLRVHSPQQYDDDLSSFRLMVVETNKTLKPQYGLEVGINGLSLRVIYPAFHQNKHIGSLEMSGQPFRLAHHIKNIFGVEYAVSITKTTFDQLKSLPNKRIDISAGEQLFYEFSSPLSSEFMTQYQADKTDYIFDDQLYTTYKIPLYDFANQYIGDLLLIENIDRIYKSIWYKFMWHLLVSICVAIFMISLLSWFVTKSIHRPLQYIVNIAEKISAGNLKQELNIDQRNDEIGRLTVAMHNMTKKLKVNLLQVQNIIEQINTMSQQLRQTAEQIAQNSLSQASNLEKTNQSIIHLTNSVGHNASNANYTFNRAKEAALLATQGDKAILNTAIVMDEITDRIHLVKEIAHQTRLLALNAAIEAAKAGKQGAGFGVVATEVRELSDRSHEAVLKISELSDNSQKVSDYAKKMFNRILPEVQATATLVENINHTCHEQTKNLNKINQMMLQLENITHQNLAVSEELAGASSEMNEQAQQLSKLMNYFIL